MKSKSSHALPVSFILRNKFTNALAIKLTFYPFHLLTPHRKSKIFLKSPRQMITSKTPRNRWGFPPVADKN